jgi:nucleoside-diphosphate-sugar epimerase
MSKLVIWGAGELGGRVARLWRQNEGPAVGFTQSLRRHATLQKLGVEPRLGSPIEYLAHHDVLLLALPGHKTQLKAIETLIENHIPPPTRAVLSSTTGYYGPSIQGVVNEDTPRGDGIRPASIAATEQAFESWAGDSGVILRFGGLYSRNRGPVPALARRGALLLRPPDKSMALIHYDDAALATYAALQRPVPENLYLGVTPPCPTRQEFYELACRLLGLLKPNFGPPLGCAPASYDVTRLRRDLLPKPAYPDWHAALER